ncbi:hypothetical protein ACFRCX_30615 [Streptomyces sp. NPDC056652]|uniref:hypothetical protein n=1 Tax=Streptomyces sp. NPDC056652 TaxID=3345893 RepID=UPI0036B7418E
MANVDDCAEAEFVDYAYYDMSVPGTWRKGGFQRRSVTVYGTRRDTDVSEKVAGGYAYLRSGSGEPQSVAVVGFKPVGSWDKLHNAGAGEWVCTAEKLDDGKPTGSGERSAKARP